MIKVLDCTLRDGGYYTNWDFSENMVSVYLNAMNNLPLEYIEVGYRSTAIEGYQGEFFYSPLKTLTKIKAYTNKKIAILINEKDVSVEEINRLLASCKNIVDLVRIAVNPLDIERATLLAKEVKSLHFNVAFNVMYLSEWHKYPNLLHRIKGLSDFVDILYLVDSYGSIFPEDLKDIIQGIRRVSDIKLGFHGHNNLELALINTLEAISSGVDLVDSTITGMGRGAGNLKTELLLTVLNKQFGWHVDFDALSEVTESFEELQKKYYWGTALPYMVSGVNSIPQKEVMSLVQKKIYSMNVILNTLTDNSTNSKDYHIFDFKQQYETIIIIGGGPNAKLHANAILDFALQNKSVCLIHSSSKNANYYIHEDIEQFFCLLGNEGYRLKSVFSDFLKKFDGTCILPPSENLSRTFIPLEVQRNTFRINEINFSEITEESHLALAIQIALNLGVKNLFFAGYDGYDKAQVSQKDIKFFKENNQIFEDLKSHLDQFYSLTPTMYESLPKSSVFKYI